MTRAAMIATGEGAYADPWHPFDATSAQLREVLSEAGFSADVLPAEEAVARLDGVDLLVVNAGDPWRDADPPQAPDEAARAGLSATTSAPTRRPRTAP